MLVTLYLTTCLVVAPARCDEMEFVFESRRGSLAQCMFEAPAFIAEWSSGHPKWKVTRWYCGPLGRSTQDI